MLVIRKLNVATKEIKGIIKGIDDRQGDLTRRITILSNDEVADLGNGINTFMEKLQNIMRLIIINSQKLEAVVGRCSRIFIPRMTVRQTYQQSRRSFPPQCRR